MSEVKPIPAKPVVPDPSDSYERSHPEHESGQGRLDNNMKATPTPRPDKLPTTVTNAQDGTRQLNGQDAAHDAATRVGDIDASAMADEPLGWDKPARGKKKSKK